MSNLIKSNYIYLNHLDKKIIDSNIKSDLFVPLTFNGSKDEKKDETEFISGINATRIEKLVLPKEEFMQDNVDAILKDASQEAMDIIEQAKSEAHLLKEAVCEEAKISGYQDGFNSGVLEVNELKTKLEQEFKNLEKEYEKKLVELEPQFVNVMISMIETITGILIEDKKEVILYLVHKVLKNAENCNNFLIKVSKDDYSFLNSHKVELTHSLKEDVLIQIIEDLSLNKNECMIETETSIIDCSLGVQFENLFMNLKLLTNI